MLDPTSIPAKFHAISSELNIAGHISMLGLVTHQRQVVSKHQLSRAKAAVAFRSLAVAHE